MILSKLVHVITTLLWMITPTVSLLSTGKLSMKQKDLVEALIKQWAPLVWLAPEEKFMPLGVDEFLHHVHSNQEKSNAKRIVGKRSNKNFEQKIPLGDTSEKAYLVTNIDIGKLLENSSSFLYGRNPMLHSVPVYGVVRICGISTGTKSLIEYELPSNRPYIPVSFDESDEKIAETSPSTSTLRIKRNTREQEKNSVYLQKEKKLKESNQFMANMVDNVKFTIDSNVNNEIITSTTKKLPSFHITYWMFYPYSQGKTVCTLNLGPFGRVPIPVMFGTCLGSRKDFGNHVGDWEHMSLFFSGSTEPEAMYVSAHDAGAYYKYNRLTGSFEFKSQETRKGILQKPNFPKTVITSASHPVLFAAQGSHGLWTAPGKHRFVRVARLYDINGFGTPWHTWKDVEITYENLRSERSLAPKWLHFKGKWGNPKSKCHPLRRIGLNFCEYADGPTGIPLKKPPFQCNS